MFPTFTFASSFSHGMISALYFHVTEAEWRGIDNNWKGRKSKYYVFYTIPVSWVAQGWPVPHHAVFWAPASTFSLIGDHCTLCVGGSLLPGGQPDKLGENSISEKQFFIDFLCSITAVLMANPIFYA